MPNRTPTDDRGEPCGIARLSARQIGWRSIGVQKLIRDPDARREQKITTGLETGVALVGGFVGWVVWQVGVDPLLRGHLPLFMRMVLMTVAAIVVAMLFWWWLLDWVRVRRFARISEIYLSSGRCAGCGYDLRGLDPEPEGCVVCPECRAAWRSSRLGGDERDTDTGSDLDDA
ncbi:MAG: hypothetical protein DHS20C14_22550 [Phycisphaeraceae bacterium]|nr:MAG: hypothetical protein DHS20C14_22550 [Phycisphaeraceae bacterium]